MKRVLVIGPALSQSGYGEHTRFVLRSLRSRPEIFDVYLHNINWGATGWLWEESEERNWIDQTLAKTINYNQSGGTFDITLHITIPGEWQRQQNFGKYIGVTAGTESTKISPQWFEKCVTQVDEVVFVSEHTKFAFENTVLDVTFDGEQKKAKIKDLKPDINYHVVGYPVKEVVPEELELELEHDFNFLTVGTWIPRKNMGNTINWFVQEFFDQDVGLIVKTSIAKNSVRDRIAMKQKLDEILKEYKDRKCGVYLLHGDLKDEEMHSLYNHSKIKALYSLSHGEGYGLPLFEAAYSGLPVVCPDWGGQVDFLYIEEKGKKNAMFNQVAYDIKPVQPEAVWPSVIEENSQWCFPKEWHVKKTLRDVYKNHGAALSKAKKLKKYLEKAHAKDEMYSKFVSCVVDESEFDVENWLNDLEVESFE
jgi:glycosyltransferase involved in cell wall biosynthesis